MMISTKGRYALRTMIDIAKNDGENRPVSIKEVSERQGISIKYLEQIISLLVKGGLLRSVRGAKGGYLFAVPLESITAGEVLRATEGSLAPVECLEKDEMDCPMKDSCPTLPIYKAIDDAVANVVDNYRLIDML